uniref:Putative transcriptional regulator BetI n=1 Tax=uncultured bacterium 1114 TaxID=548901 RepID=B8R950_9BACT|nr:putative transcriptional regulator BetI [uncultured bacterium 1114]
MPKLGMEPIRRRQLIDATISSIGRYGYGEATVQRISRAAGVSSGIIHHYFGGKDELLEASMRALLAELRREVVERLARATGPRARLEAIVDGNFAPSQFDPPVVAAWLVFWSQARHEPRLARLQRLHQRRLHSNLHHAFAQAVSPATATQAAKGLAALIDGLWLSAALSGAQDIDQARAIAHRFLDHELNDV